MAYAVAILVTLKVTGGFILRMGSNGPFDWILTLIALVVLVTLFTGITFVTGAPKQFGHYFLFGKMTGISVGPGVYPTFGNILSLKIFPADENIIEILVTVTCASIVGGQTMKGRGPDVTVTLNLEAALDPLNVAEILSLGSVASVNLEEFRTELQKFAVTKIKEHAKNVILGIDLDTLNASRFEVINQIVSEMWLGLGSPPQGDALKESLRVGSQKIIQGLVVTALRVESVSEPADIKNQRTKTQVALASVETAHADLAVARVREEQNKMEAIRFAEVLRTLTTAGVPPEQVAVIAAAINDKIKATSVINVVSQSPNANGGNSSVASAAVIGAAINGQGGNS